MLTREGAQCQLGRERRVLNAKEGKCSMPTRGYSIRRRGEVLKVNANEGERCLAQTKGVLEHKEGGMLNPNERRVLNTKEGVLNAKEEGRGCSFLRRVGAQC